MKVEGDVYNSEITFENATVMGVSGSLNVTEGDATIDGYSVGFAGIDSAIGKIFR